MENCKETTIPIAINCLMGSNEAEQL